MRGIALRSSNQRYLSLLSKINKNDRKTGIKVLDLTHMLAGPYTTMILADLGAEVVKIEQPQKGDITRNLLKDDPKYSLDGVGAYHLTLARNKKSFELDLKSDSGKELFLKLFFSKTISYGA